MLFIHLTQTRLLLKIIQCILEKKHLSGVMTICYSHTGRLAMGTVQHQCPPLLWLPLLMETLLNIFVQNVYKLYGNASFCKVAGLVHMRSIHILLLEVMSFVNSLSLKIALQNVEPKFDLNSVTCSSFVKITLLFVRLLAQSLCYSMGAWTGNQQWFSAFMVKIFCITLQSVALFFGIMSLKVSVRASQSVIILLRCNSNI